MRPVLALLAAVSLSAIAAPPDIPGHVPSDMLMPMKMPPPSELPNRGKVLTLIKSDGYAYIEVGDGKTSRWIAGPLVPMRVGDTVGYTDGMVASNFHSKALNRDFPTLLFADHVAVIPPGK